MNRLFYCIIALLFVLCSHDPSLKAQENTDYSVFMRNAGNNAVLYRGNRAFYYNLRYNGHYFWETVDFKLGTVMYNGKLYRDVLLNIDACRNEVQVKCPEQFFSVILPSKGIEWFTIGDKLFEIPSGVVKGKVYEGFHEVLLKDGDVTVYKKVRKNLTSNTINNNGSGIGYDDPNYNEAVFNYFQYVGRYYILKDGVFKKISKNKALKLTGRI